MPELPVKPRGARALPGWKWTMEGVELVSISSSRMENTQLTSEKPERLSWPAQPTRNPGLGQPN